MHSASFVGSCLAFGFVLWLEGFANITLAEQDHPLRRVLPLRAKTSQSDERARIRTSPHLVIYFQNRRLIVENYITGGRFQGTPETIRLLDFFKSQKTLREAARAFGDYTQRSTLDSINNLVKNGLLIARDSDQNEVSKRFSNEWLWPVPSRYYHFATRLHKPYSTTAEVRKFYEKNLRNKEQPSIYKSYPESRRIELPSFTGAEAPFFATMRHRRTTRSFSGAPISLKQLSRITYYTWGKISTYMTREFGQLLHKTAPSAGARHPIEAYAVVNNVTGIDRGIYHYSVKDHSLELLKRGDFREKCVSLAAGQSWTKNASAFFIMAASVARTAWKYRIPRVYRAFLLDAGHLSQSFLLVSTALGLGAFCIGIIGDVEIERELDLDGVNEIALFAVGVGQPLRQRGQPQTLSTGADS